MARPSPSDRSSERGRFSAARKADAVLRLLRGEDLEALSRELGVLAATLSAWRQEFLDGGKAALKSRPADGRDEQLRRLQAKVGELTMDNELLRLRCGEEVPGLPFAPRRPRP
jgi:transposase-like protein